MPHWSEVYPHELHASVVLKDNKIISWKVGNGKLRDKYMIDILIKTNPEYLYQEKTWVVNNEAEHREVFEIYSTKWLDKWEIHKDFQGFNPHINEPFINNN